MGGLIPAAILETVQVLTLSVQAESIEGGGTMPAVPCENAGLVTYRNTPPGAVLRAKAKLAGNRSPIGRQVLVGGVVGCGQFRRPLKSPPSVIFDTRNWRYSRDYVAEIVALEQRITNLGY
jgi:hypothetical protein